MKNEKKIKSTLKYLLWSDNEDPRRMGRGDWQKVWIDAENTGITKISNLVELEKGVSINPEVFCQYIKEEFARICPSDFQKVYKEKTKITEDKTNIYTPLKICSELEPFSKTVIGLEYKITSAQMLPYNPNYPNLSTKKLNLILVPKKNKFDQTPLQRHSLIGYNLMGSAIYGPFLKEMGVKSVEALAKQDIIGWYLPKKGNILGISKYRN